MRRNRLVILALVISTTILFGQSPDIVSLKTKAQSGDVAAQVALGHAYEKGGGVPQNEKLAAKWYRAAADQGNAEAQTNLGFLYRAGRGVDQDKAEAVKWYRLAAKQGYGPAMFNLATCYYNGDGVAVDDRLAYSWFVLAKRAGSTEAGEAVARMEADLDAEKLTFAKITLAEVVEKGTDLAQADPALAFEMYRGIADSRPDSRVTDARFRVGRMYEEGIGVAADRAKAISYYEASGTPQALRHLASMYLNGLGVPVDQKKGLAALKKAVELGDPRARQQLAGYYWDGGPIPQNYKLAVKEYAVLASGYADPAVFYRLGSASRDGLGMKKDAETACMYFMIASALGSTEGTNAMHSCSQEELQKAQDKAKRWLGENTVVQNVINRRTAAVQDAATK